MPFCSACQGLLAAYCLRDSLSLQLFGSRPSKPPEGLRFRQLCSNCNSGGARLFERATERRANERRFATLLRDKRSCDHGMTPFSASVRVASTTSHVPSVK